MEYEIQAGDLLLTGIDRDKYIKAIHNAEYSNLGAFQFSPAAQKKLESIILSMFDKHNRGTLLGIVFHLLKELIINATKANLKTVATNLKKKTNTDLSLDNFKQMLVSNSEDFQKLQAEAKKQGYWVKIKSIVDEEGVYFLVKNNLPLSEKANATIREKLRKAMEYENLAEFYMDQAQEEQEGAGIGFALIITALKGMNLDGKNLTIGVEKGNTVVRLYLPFDAVA